jgi:uncharacterized membrane protein HdeD (DUF308 family)
MTDREAVTSQLAEWVSLGAAVLFTGLGILALRYPETAILRLATLGIPGWPVYAMGVLEIAAGGILLYRPARIPAAAVLAVTAVVGSALSMAYREPGSALEGFGLAVLALAVLLLEKSRRPDMG